MATSGSDRLQTATVDDVRRLLECVNALRVAIPIDRAAVLANRLLAILEASVVAIDGEINGEARRLVTAALAPGLPKWTPAVEPVVSKRADQGGAAGESIHPHGRQSFRHEIRLLPPTTPIPTFADVRPAGIRSVFSIGAAFSAITAWRPAPFGEHQQILLQLIHPEIAWIFDSPARSVPEGMDLLLRLLLEGKKEKDIARQLRRSEHTVHAHVKRVYRHFGVNSRSQLLVRVYGLENAD